MYTQIAQLVQKRVDEDEAKGIPEATVLRDNVDRKLVKQTVMTSVYGVTFVGARHQIGNRLKERGWEDDRLVYKASCYGARVSVHIYRHHFLIQILLSLPLLQPLFCMHFCPPWVVRVFVCTMFCSGQFFSFEFLP